MKDEIIRFLLEPENLEVALNLSGRIQEARIAVFKEFWGNVHALLDERLISSSYGDLWKVWQSRDITSRWSVLGLYWSAAEEIQPKDGPRQPGGIHICFECLAGIPEPGFFGIKRDRDVETITEMDADLVKALITAGFKTSSSSVGWKYLENLGLPRIELRHDETVLALARDNSLKAKVLANEMAGILWNIFTTYRETLESLNSKYPYSFTAPESPLRVGQS